MEHLLKEAIPLAICQKTSKKDSSTFWHQKKNELKQTVARDPAGCRSFKPRSSKNQEMKYFGQNNLLLHVLFLRQKKETIPMIQYSIVVYCPITDQY